MNIFFVVSACLWSWLVGRCIAFGPKCSVITWTPSIKHDSWYLLTTIPAKIPTLLLVFMPHIFTLLSVPTLFLNNTLTHSIMVIMLVSEHCYIPIFVTRIYDSIPQWSSHSDCHLHSVCIHIALTSDSSNIGHEDSHMAVVSLDRDSNQKQYHTRRTVLC